MRRRPSTDAGAAAMARLDARARALSRRSRLPAWFAALAIGLRAAGAAETGSHAPAYVNIPPAAFVSVLESEPDAQPQQLPAFALRSEPVTNAQFLAFVTAHPQWRRGRVPTVFADGGYLTHWQSADALGPAALPEQPVTRVSWFAAQAYCEAEDARLPSWIEWERAAAASDAAADARGDAAWRRKLLDWYSRPSSGALAAVGGEPNLFGVRDLHGLVWEWVDDYAAMMVSADSRDQNDPDRLKFCGAAAMSLRDRDNYALLMRIAMLSSLKAADTTRNLGFRCARDTKESTTR